LSENKNPEILKIARAGGFATGILYGMITPVEQLAAGVIIQHHGEAVPAKSDT